MDRNEEVARVRSLIEDWTKAVREGDMEGVLARHTADIVMFDVPMPLQARGMEEYRKTWELFFRYSPGGPGSFDIEEMRVEVGGDIAYACGIVGVVGNRVRLTLGLRREEGEWRIAHEHHSYPHDLPEDA